MLAVVLSVSAGIGSIVIVNFMIFLQARGVDYAVAVSLGTLFGPAQVGARVVERLFGNRYHPIWTMIASCSLMAIGLVMLTASFPVLLLIILIYGAGYGISWIGRGTLPLALFGPVRFPAAHGQAGVSKPDRAGAGAFCRRAADRMERAECHHRPVDRTGADQRGADCVIMVNVPDAAHGGTMTMLILQSLTFDDLTVGMKEKWSKTVSSSDVVGFAEVSGDRNPIHLSEHFAAKTPFGTRIAHGLYTASLISAVLGTRLPGPGRDLYFADIEFPRARQDRRYRRRDGRSCRTGAVEIASTAGLHLRGRR